MIFRFLLISIVILTAYEVALAAPQEHISSTSDIQHEASIQVYPTNKKSQSAFNGFSIPTYPDYVPIKSYSNIKNDDNTELNTNIASVNKLPLETWSSIIARSLVPLSSFALFFGAKTMIYTYKFLVLVTISLGLTTLICSFTPLCQITFAGVNFNNTQLAEMARPYITTENLNKGSAIIGHAIDTFKVIQNDLNKKKPVSEEINNENVASIAESMERRRRRYT